MASWYDSDEEPMPAITTMDEIRAANEKSANEPLSDTYLPQVGNDYDSESSDSDANWQQMKYNNEDSAQKVFDSLRDKYMILFFDGGVEISGSSDSIVG